MPLYIPGTDDLYESGLDNLVQAALYGNAVISACAVVERSPQIMGVRVGAGTIRGSGLQVTVAQQDLAVTAGGAEPRVDLVSVNFTTGVATVTGGTPAATNPKPPALPATDILLAYISVGITAIVVVQANIRDRRLYVGPGMGPTLMPEQATTSGTSKDFTGIPSWAKRVTMMFAGVSTNGSSELILQLGDAGGIETTGYLGGVSSSSGAPSVSHTTGFHLSLTIGPTSVYHGPIVFMLEDPVQNTWVTGSVLGREAPGTNDIGGSKSLSAVLDRVRLTTLNGTDAFDAGAISVSYE